MFKKILLITILFFMFFSLSFSLNVEQGEIYNQYNKMSQSQKDSFLSTKISSPDGKSEITVKQAFDKEYLQDGITGESTKDALNAANVIITNSEGQSDIKPAGTPAVDNPNSLSSPNFTIETSLFSPGGKNIKGDTAKATAQNALLTIIEKLILAIGVVALFIMTIGAGYMIMYHGEDSLLTRGKYMFNSGLIAIALALSAELIVKFVAYLLY